PHRWPQRQRQPAGEVRRVLGEKSGRPGIHSGEVAQVATASRERLTVALGAAAAGHQASIVMSCFESGAKTPRSPKALRAKSDSGRLGFAKLWECDASSRRFCIVAPDIQKRCEEATISFRPKPRSPSLRQKRCRLL